MKMWKVCALTVSLLAAFALVAPDDADARRMGGGRSFGGSPTMSRPAPAPSAPMGSASQPGSAINRQAQTAGAGAATASRGFLGGMGGLMGGLLAGSLLGSLFMGNGFSGAGGGFLDIVIIGLVVYVAYRFLRRRKPQDNASRYSAPSGNDYRTGSTGGMPGGNSTMSNGSGSAWDNLSSRSDNGFAGATENVNMPQSDTIPADFDQEDFLRGAKMAYVRMQESWDKRDLDDIAQFATPVVLDELRKQHAEEPNQTVTELLLVNASLMEVKNDNGQQRAVVYFDVLMREDSRATQPEQVREVWHFVRPQASNESWKLDGIQQVF